MGRSTTERVVGLLALLLVCLVSNVHGIKLLFTAVNLGFNRFEFVLLEVAVGGTQINFTDQGFDTTTGDLRTGTTTSEGIITWTAPSPKLDPGITVIIDFSAGISSITTTFGTAVAALNVMDFIGSTTTDQVIAFTQDASGTKTYIAAFNGNSAFTDATSDTTTGLPTGLAVGLDSLSRAASGADKNYFYSQEVAAFSGGDISEMRGSIADVFNWVRGTANVVSGSTFNVPTEAPTSAPTTLAPTFSPTKSPSTSPTVSPTFSPSKSPTISPTFSPSISPTVSPTASPSISPTFGPTVSPTPPTFAPTSSPTEFVIPTPPALSESTIIGISVGGGAVGLFGLGLIGWFFLYKPNGVSKVEIKQQDEVVDDFEVGDGEEKKKMVKPSI